MRNKDSIATIVQDLEREFVSGIGAQSSEYVREDLYTDINTIYAYLNSKHISGSHDSMGREKPFFNIVLAARNIWFRATDLDRRNILLTPSKEQDTIGAFLLSVHLQDWMRREHFGKFLNTWGIEQAGFNSAVLKFVEKDKRLIPSIVPWSRLIVDQLNFNDNPIIEVLELTEAQMYERFDADKVDNLISTAKARETLDKQRKDNKNNYYKLYEVHGQFSLDKITDNEKDCDTFVQQMHIVTFVPAQKKGEWDEFTLYRGREEKSPYMLTSLMPSTDGSVSLHGSVKNLFEAQWMVNHSMKAVKDQLDLASKLIFQTSDGKFIGQNALSAIESGDILVHQLNQPLTQVNNGSHDVTQLTNYASTWKQLGSEINGISDAMMGVAPKAGTAWRQTEAMLQESHSLFEVMTENRGLDLEEILRTFIIPHLLKRMSNDKEVVATLEMHGIDRIEERYVKYEARRQAKKKLFKMLIGEQEMESFAMDDIEGDIRAQLQDMGEQRFFKPSMVSWKEEFKNLEFDIEIDITGEQKDKQAVYTTLNTALQMVMNPGFTENKQAQIIVNKILSETGHLSPLEMRQMASALPATQPQGGGGNTGVEQLVELEQQ